MIEVTASINETKPPYEPLWGLSQIYTLLLAEGNIQQGKMP